MDDAARKQVETLEEFSRRLANTVDLLKRTQQLGDGTHASAITAIMGLCENPAIDNLRDMLGELHAALHTDAKGKLDAKYAAEYAALEAKAPKKLKRRKLQSVA